MLQRIYGTAWAKKDDLDAYLHMLEEAEKRDHRKLGKQLDLFHLQEERRAWCSGTPTAGCVWQEIEQYMRRVLIATRLSGSEDAADHGSHSLWEKSGHWENYRENMFTTESENRDYAVKPMNCPGHVQIFNTACVPTAICRMRLAEFGSCHRNEPSGALHGLMRVRAFTQDDATHLLHRRPDPVRGHRFHRSAAQGLPTSASTTSGQAVHLRPDKRVGSDEVWDKAEAGLRAALDRTACLGYDLLPGEGAFYGPKIEFHMKDAIGRSWQCGTCSSTSRCRCAWVPSTSTRTTPASRRSCCTGPSSVRSSASSASSSKTTPATSRSGWRRCRWW
jgi:threonyl-tRNA synthetase